MRKIDFGTITVTDAVINKVKAKMEQVEESIDISDAFVAEFLDNLQQKLSEEHSASDLLFFLAETYLIDRLDHIKQFNAFTHGECELCVGSESIH